MNYFEIVNQYNSDNILINDEEKFINYTLDYLKLKNVLFNVIIVDNEYILKLNKEYRNINRETDVITFALEDNKMIDNPNIRILGDIYISYDKVKTQALEYGHSEKRELLFLTVHGILHLLGYDHMNKKDEKIMFDLQKELLDSYGIKR